MKIIQISDTHLFANINDEMFGVNSKFTLQQVLKKITAEDLVDTDMIFLTGDVSQDETAQSYQNIAIYLSELNRPVYWIPGNHDDIPKMESVFNHTKNFYRQFSLVTPHWHFIFLNSKVDGTPEGEIASAELNKLRTEIALNKHKKIAIVMHHHPAPVNTPLIDQYILRERDKFWDVIRHTSVKLIICGHVHEDYSFVLNNIQIESAPSTWLQWMKGTKDLQMEKKIGYKIYIFDSENFNVQTKMWST